MRNGFMCVHARNCAWPEQLLEPAGVGEPQKAFPLFPTPTSSSVLQKFSLPCDPPANRDLQPCLIARNSLLSP